MQRAIVVRAFLDLARKSIYLQSLVNLWTMEWSEWNAVMMLQLITLSRAVLSASGAGAQGEPYATREAWTGNICLAEAVLEADRSVLTGWKLCLGSCILLHIDLAVLYVHSA